MQVEVKNLDSIMRAFKSFERTIDDMTGAINRLQRSFEKNLKIMEELHEQERVRLVVANEAAKETAD